MALTMDVFSHALWGGVTVGRKSRGDFLLAGAFSVLPDLVGEGTMFLLILLGLPDMPDLGHGHPDIVDFPAYAQDFYNSGHSLFVFASCFALVWLIRRKVLWPLAGWGIHILIDIPTHSLKLFPTPFLWPFSSYKMDGIAWRSPSILLLNFSALAIAYCLWLYQRRSAGKRRDRPSV